MINIKYDPNKIISKPFIKAKIGLDNTFETTSVKFLIDTGAEISLLNKSNRPINCPIKNLNDDQFSISAFGGEIVEIISQYIEVNLKIKSLNIVNIRLFLTDQNQNILGNDLVSLLQSHNFNIFNKNSELNNFIYSENDHILTPHSSSVVKLSIPNLKPVDKKMDLLIQPPEIKLKHIIFDECVTSSQDPFCIIQNGTDQVFQISKGTFLGSFVLIEKIPAHSINFIQRISEIEDLDYRAELELERNNFIKNRQEKAKNFKIDPEKLKTDYKGKEIKTLLELLNKYKIIFKQNDEDRGFSEFVEKFDFINDEPDFESLYSKPLKFSPKHEEAVEHELQKLIVGGIITECSSGCNAPLFPVISVRPGSDKPKVRLVQNYTKLNKEISERRYPLVAAQDLLDKTGKIILDHYKNNPKQKLYFTALDICSAFHMIALHKDDHLVTAFSYGPSQYCFKVLPFGIKNSPSEFNYALAKIIKPVTDKFKNIITYLDDILIVAPVNETLLILEALFAEFRNQCIVLALNKCHFLEDDIIFLGKHLSRHGVKERDTQINKVVNFETPANLKQLQKFLGHCCFVASRVPYLNATLSPLHTLVGKVNSGEEKFKWELEHQTAFTEAQKAMTRAIETAHFDPQKTVFICSDASKIAVGFSLGNETVENGEIKRVICALGSKKLPDKLHHACSRNLEIYGILLTLKVFRWILMGIEKIKIYTDNKPAASFFNKTNNLIDPLIPTRIKNLFTLYIEFNEAIEIEYISNKSELLGLSDYLSRESKNDNLTVFQNLSDKIIPKEINTVKTRIIESPLLLISIKRSDLIANQGKDEFCLKIVKLLGTKAPVKFRNKYFRSLEGTLLCGESENRTNLVVVAEKDHNFVIRQIHKYFLHAGFNKCIMEIRKLELFIPKLHEVLNRVVSKCFVCQLNKFPRSPVREIQFKIPPMGPFTNFEMDLFSTENWKIPSNFVLVLVDRFSWFTFAEIIPNKSSVTIAQKLVKIIVTNGFENSTINSDGGKEFQGVVSHVADILPFIRFTTSAYQPSANGVSEKSNHRIKSGLQLAKVTVDNFESLLALVVAKINRTPMKSLNGLSPFECYFARAPPLLIPENEMAHHSLAQTRGSELNSWLNDVQVLRDQIAELSISNFQNTLNKFIASEKIEPIKRNDVVVCLGNCELTEGRKLGRLDWWGPYLVHQIRTNRLILKCPLTGSSIKRNIRLVRKLKLDHKDKKAISDGLYKLENGLLSIADYQENFNKLKNTEIREIEDSEVTETNNSLTSDKTPRDRIDTPDELVAPEIEKTIQRWQNKRPLRDLKRVNYKE